MNDSHDTSDCLIAESVSRNLPLRPPLPPNPEWAEPHHYRRYADVLAAHVTTLERACAQEDVWVDGRGNTHLIALMPREYALNALCWLHENVGEAVAHTPLTDALRRRILEPRVAWGERRGRRRYRDHLRSAGVRP